MYEISIYRGNSTVALIKCPKCGVSLDDECITVWKCKECGKAFKANLAKLHKIQEVKKQKVGKRLLKCSSCGNALDDGDEKITCRCSSCDNVLGGNLEYFVTDDLEHKIIEATLSHLDDTAKESTVSKNLIRCPDCGREVSKRARVCPGCGCPLSEMITSGVVRIKMPNNIVEGWVGLFSSRSATIMDSHGKILWKGQHGENASFTIDEPTKITINLGGWANEISGTVCPKKKYSLVQDMGLHMLATFRITEVDVIDAD